MLSDNSRSREFGVRRRTSIDGEGLQYGRDSSFDGDLALASRLTAEPADPEWDLRYLDPAPTVGVVIPTLNEAENLRHVLPGIPQWVGEVIIVDGGSTDGTPEVVREIVPHARVLHQKGTGKGAALIYGFAAAESDIIVTLDADGSTDPAEIPRYVAALRTGADFAKGTRFAMGGGSADITRLRRWGNWVLTTVVNLVWHIRFTDLCYGYNAFWRSQLPTLGVDCRGFEIETLLNIRAAAKGLRIVEVPSYESSRVSGVSNLRVSRDGVRVLRTILAEWIRPR